MIEEVKNKAARIRNANERTITVFRELNRKLVELDGMPIHHSLVDDAVVEVDVTQPRNAGAVGTTIMSSYNAAGIHLLNIGRGSQIGVRMLNPYLIAGKYQRPLIAEMLTAWGFNANYSEGQMDYYESDTRPFGQSQVKDIVVDLFAIVLDTTHPWPEEQADIEEDDRPGIVL